MPMAARPTIRRFIITAMATIGFLSLVAAAVFYAGFVSVYYGSVRRALESQGDGDALEQYFYENSGERGELFARAAREYAGALHGKGRMEVWAVDGAGRVVYASGGFEIPPDSLGPDYAAAMAAPDGRGSWIGRYGGEMVYAFTYRVDLEGGAACALRYLVSLRDINAQLAVVGALALLAWLFMAALLYIAARLCVRGIAEPLAKVSAGTALIAEGDYAARISLPRARGEIRELSEGINHMAEKIAFAEKTKMDFISTISHELRTPLTAIKGWGETLLGGDAGGDLTRRGLGVIIEESVRLARLVEELLDFSRLQSKRLALQREPIDVLAELDDAVFFFRERAARDGVALNCNTSEIPAPMLGDPARIRQVFINLLDNAFKHTPQGGEITVTSDFDPAPPPGQPPLTPPESLTVTIQDTGCGVSEADLPHITEKFFKSSAETRGSGIGLAVVEEVLRGHGCALEFESQEGAGLAVRITFPLGI